MPEAVSPLTWGSLVVPRARVAGLPLCDRTSPTPRRVLRGDCFPPRGGASLGRASRRSPFLPAVTPTASSCTPLHHSLEDLVEPIATWPPVVAAPGRVAVDVHLVYDKHNILVWAWEDGKTATKATVSATLSMLEGVMHFVSMMLHWQYGTQSICHGCA
jgi:hypothetical protein